MLELSWCGFGGHGGLGWGWSEQAGQVWLLTEFVVSVAT